MVSENKIAKSFSAAKYDLDTFKASMNDWVIFLDDNQRKTKTRLRELERRVRMLETEKKIRQEFDF